MQKYKFSASFTWKLRDAAEAIAREKQLKFWKRDWKIKLIEEIIQIGTTGRASSDIGIMGPGLRQDDQVERAICLTSPTASCRRNNSRKTFRRIGA